MLKHANSDKEVNETFTAKCATLEESYEMNGIKSNNDVYQGIPIERLLVDTHRILARIENSKSSPSLFDLNTGVFNENLMQVSVMLSVLERRVRSLLLDDSWRVEILEELRVHNTRYAHLAKSSTQDFIDDVPFEAFTTKRQRNHTVKSGDHGIGERKSINFSSVTPGVGNSSVDLLNGKRCQPAPKGVILGQITHKSHSRRSQKSVTLSEIKQFRKEIFSRVSKNRHSISALGLKESQALREAQVENILDAARALKHTATSTKEKIVQSSHALEGFSKSMENMVDKTNDLNKKTKARVKATWDILKMQCLIAVFAFIAVAILFFIIRIFPKQF
eukprot:Stramenopile-MAST_4_protein_1304